MVGSKKLFLLQAVEREKTPSWEKIFQSMTLYNTNKSLPRNIFFFISHKLGWDMEYK